MSRHSQVPQHYELHPQLAADTHPVAAFALCELRLMDDANYPWLVLVPRLPEAREPFWKTFVEVGKKNPGALRQVVTMMAI